MAYTLRMARPKKGAELGASTHLGLRIPPDLRRWLDAIAKHNDRTLAEEVRAALIEHIEDWTGQGIKGLEDFK